MTRMQPHVAFRAQLVIREQRQLYDYWVKSAGTRDMPARADISPADFPRLLPNVSLIDIEDNPLRFRVRLAGTRVREIYDREVTGLYLNDIHSGKSHDYWQSAHRRLAETARPSQGVLRSPREAKEHLVQFWLRLPLMCTARKPAMILCYDVCIPIAEMDNPAFTRQHSEPVTARA